jgi:hypothetical protein
MANPSALGFRPVKYMNGSPWMGQANVYAVATNCTTAIGWGDPVVMTGGALTYGETSLKEITRATATNTSIAGVAVGLEITAPGLSNGRSPNLDLPVYVPASGTGKVVAIRVVDDIDVLFEAQTSVTTTFAAASLNQNSPMILAATNTVTGVSASYLDEANVATTTTFPWRIVDIANRPDNPSDTNQKVLVRINASQVYSVTGI